MPSWLPFSVKVQKFALQMHQQQQLATGHFNLDPNRVFDILIPANPAVGQEIWAVLSLLPYEARYRLYGEWEKDDECNPMVLSAKQTAKLDTRRILKRLAKENLKQLGRMVAKLAHANPMTVLRTIGHQIEAYRDMIAPVADAFKFLTELEYDILEYVVIERLVQGGREKLKDDGLNL